jgi:hypothetical protein
MATNIDTNLSFILLFIHKKEEKAKIKKCSINERFIAFETGRKKNIILGIYTIAVSEFAKKGTPQNIFVVQRGKIPFNSLSTLYSLIFI